MTRAQPWPIATAHPEPALRPLTDGADGRRAEVAILVRACLEASQACWACADAGLADAQVQVMVDCIRSTLSCAEICSTTARVLSRAVEDPVAHDLLRACETACRTCAEVCESLADLSAHCRTAAEACRRCERACRELLTWP